MTSRFRTRLSSLRRLGLVAFTALWALSALPLLSLPVDWAAICGCQFCPMEGGPSCCCRNYETWPNADGSAGKRAALAHPSAVKAQSSCVGPAALVHASLSANQTPAVCGVLAPDFRKPSRRASSQPSHRRLTLPPAHLPRPPPAQR